MSSERLSEVHSLHFDLPGIPAGTELTYHLAMREYPILAHTDETRKEAQEENRFLRLLPPDAISHHVHVQAPADAVALGYTTQRVVIDGIETNQVLTMSISIPRKVRRLRSNVSQYDVHSKLAHRELRANLLQSERLELENAPDLMAAVNDGVETAVAILYQHPELVNLNLASGDNGARLVEICIREALAKHYLLSQQIQKYPTAWSKTVRVMDDGKPAVDDEGKPVFTMELDPYVKKLVADPLNYALMLARNAEGLKGQQWSVQYGLTRAAYGARITPVPKFLESAAPPRAATDVRWKIKNLTPSAGLAFEDVVPFTPGGTANWRCEGYWSSQDDKAVGPFTPEMQKALADGKLYMVFDDLDGLLIPDRDDPRKYYVNLEKRGDARKASGVCQLNADKTELQYLVTTSAGPFNKAFFGLQEPSGKYRVAHEVVVRNAGAVGTMTVKAKNHWLRHLSAYVEFLDPSGKAKAPPDWATRLPVAEAAALFDKQPTKRFLDLVNPVEAMMGIPLSADTTHLMFPVPSDASMVRLSFGGLGSGKRDETACLPGEILTVTLEFALPVIILAAGGKPGKEEGGLLKLIKEKPVLCAIMASLATIYTFTSEDPGRTALKIGQKLLPALAKAGITKLSAAIAEMIAVGAAKRAIPFVNIAFLLADIAATSAAIGQTSTAVANSPRVHVMEITRSIDLRITITASSVWGKFPDHHHHLNVIVVYDSGATLPALTQRLPDETISKDIVVEFREVPAAGNLRVMVFFYAENSWQSGQGASAWMKAEANSGAGSAVLTVPPIPIDLNEVPLGTWSVYEHMEKLVFEGNKHLWKGTKTPPAATKFTPAEGGGSITKLHSVTVAQYPLMVGYGWQVADGSNNSFTVQNISMLQPPDDASADPQPDFKDPGGIGYDIVSPQDGSGRNFYIDPRGNYDEGGNPEAGFHLRRVRLIRNGARPEFKKNTNESWGRFRRPIDAMFVHPDGYVFAIQRGVHAIFRLQIPNQPYTDKDAPLAVPLSGEGQRHGMIGYPIAIAPALDGRVLVLEAANNRVQCFDVNGNPVPYFTDPQTRAATPVLRVKEPESSFTLLDMAAEAKGHVFVLGFSGDGHRPEQYRVDLYDPAGTLLTSTPNVTAARLSVDLLRNLYTLNYETLRGRDRRLEPSISHWRPPAPPKKGEV